MSAQQSRKTISSSYNSSASNTTVTTTSTRERMAQNYMLVWVDASIDQTNNDCQNTLTQLRAVSNNVIMCNQPNECMQFFDKFNGENVFVITSASLGEHLVPEIHGMPKLEAIYIFSENISYHQEWTKHWKKIKGIHNDIKDICDVLKAGVKQVNQDSISISFVTTNEAVYSENLNQLEPTYMYTQIFKEILLEMDHNHNRAVKVLAVYYREFYHDNMAQLNIIDDFEHSYHREQAIWWYTRDCFTYEMLNRALRTLDANTIINMGFFIHDLHQQIHGLHIQQLPSYGGKPFIVYRGQGLLRSDFDKLKKTTGGLMSFNNFLSTSNDQDVSLLFAESASGNPDMMGILFIMTVDPRISSAPFASIKDVSYYKTEEEILFSMHTVFRIGAIKQMDNNDQLYQVELQLTADDDEQLRQLTTCMNEETRGDTGWKRLGSLLLRTGHFDKAEELYNTLLEQSSSESDKQHFYHFLGYVKNDQGDFDQAIGYYEKALEIREKILPANDHSLAISYDNIGGVYNNMGKYSKALSFYEKAREIFEKTLPADHPDLGTSYNNIGWVYGNMGEYSKARSFFEEALGIWEKTLPENHPDLAKSYHNLGSVYDSMGEYSKALSFFEKALGIKEKTLPANHPSLAISYSNVGEAYRHMGEYSKALSFYEKSLQIRETTFSANDPDLARSYHNLGSAYDSMGEYSKALSFYEKTLAIREKTLPANHPDTATSYNNIGSVYSAMGEYSKALSFYEKALEMWEKTLPDNHHHLAQSNSTIGLVYDKMREYSKALLFHEKALGIWEKTLPENRPGLATFYNNIGGVYFNIREYFKALSLYEKALGIQQKTLPENHPDTATSYNNIGLVYDNIGEYSKALSFYEKASEILEKTLPANHPSLATPYNNIGGVYVHRGEYSKALSFYEKAREIFEKTLPANHPSLATFYSNIALMYDNMGEYSKALSFYEKVGAVQEKTLPANHPLLATSYYTIGFLYKIMEEYSKALSYLERALCIWQTALPPDHRDLKRLPVQESVRAELLTHLRLANGILITLLERHFETSLLAVQNSMLDLQAARYFIDREIFSQSDNHHPTIIPTDTFRALDGYITIAALEQLEFRWFYSISNLKNLPFDLDDHTVEKCSINHEKLHKETIACGSIKIIIIKVTIGSMFNSSL
ncbi:unnamed protein product [Adineta steineri]|uniref:UDP-N-acetylglucosamine--peptide N-acetylglucosaminyltransferase SPINDLY n=1 Tax=Adineta steineri TaxID=433720 RepID=A0A819D8T8_9BILA|nr:unnamed protein product [Adineta steineri]CAF3831517.1 unnamed protein product [Adineta steineri]